MLNDEPVMVLVMEKFGINSFVQTTEETFFETVVQMKEMYSADAEELNRRSQELLAELLPENLYFDDHLVEIFFRSQRWLDYSANCVELVCAEYAQAGGPIEIADYYTQERGVIWLH